MKIKTTLKFPLTQTFLKKIYLFIFGHILRHVRSSFPNQGLNLCPLQWKCGVLTIGLPEKSLIPTLESSFSQNQPRFIYYTWLCLCNSRMSYSSQHFPQYIDLSVRPVFLQEVPPLSIHFLLGHLAHFSITCASCKPKVRSKF